MRILMVCLGNICRSPLAEGIMAHKVAAHGLDWQIDSAGTGNWHVGNLPDSRSIAVARKHSVDITNQRARQFHQTDFERFDLIYVMDKSNLRNVANMAPTEAAKAKVRLIMAETEHEKQEVPDPYYDDDGFEEVFQMLDLACEQAIGRITKQ